MRKEGKNMTPITIEQARDILKCSTQYVYKLLKKERIILTKESVENYSKTKNSVGRPKKYV